MVQFMYENELSIDFKELYKLVVLILTVPWTTSTIERSLSALKRIKTYIRAIQGQERLRSLSIICIKK